MKNDLNYSWGCQYNYAICNRNCLQILTDWREEFHGACLDFLLRCGCSPGSVAAAAAALINGPELSCFCCCAAGKQESVPSCARRQEKPPETSRQVSDSSEALDICPL